MKLAAPRALYLGVISDTSINIHALDALAQTLSRDHQHWFRAFRFTFDDEPNFYQFKIIFDGESVPCKFFADDYSKVDMQSLQCATGDTCLVRLKKCFIDGVARPMVAEVRV